MVEPSKKEFDASHIHVSGTPDYKTVRCVDIGGCKVGTLVMRDAIDPRFTYGTCDHCGWYVTGKKEVSDGTG